MSNPIGADEMLDCIEELEAKLAKAVDFIEDLLSGRDRDDDWRIEANATIAELKGQDDDITD